MTLTSPLPSPLALKTMYPLPPSETLFLQETQTKIHAILHNTTTQVVAIIGPCSIHDEQACVEYGEKLARLQSQIATTTLLIFRLFIEKPRSLFGWKGLLYDPLLDGSDRIDLGLAKSRALLLRMASLRVPCALEFVDPLSFSYVSDLVSWGFIGARTSASQIHRQMASGASFPMGFKNDLQGRCDEAIRGILSARMPHTHLGINEQGAIATLKTIGNPLTHLVLRGGDHSTNYDPASIKEVLHHLHMAGLEKRLLIDCSHGNSAKNALHQVQVLRSILKQRIPSTDSPLKGWMLESHLYAGNQPLCHPLQYGISITDSCLGWEETEALLLESHSLS